MSKGDPALGDKTSWTTGVYLKNVAPNYPASVNGFEILHGTTDHSIAKIVDMR